MNRECAEDAPRDLLIIGYGNQLRSDDGVGPKVVEMVAGWQLPGVRTVVCHQLAPELAVPLANAAQVMFVDAGIGSRSLRVRRVAPLQSAQVMTHTVDPGALLQLTQRLYNRCPPALSLTIPAEDFRFGDNLSEVCRQGMQAALSQIRVLAIRPPAHKTWPRREQKRRNVRQPRPRAYPPGTSL